jgi:hypothetical protein
MDSLIRHTEYMVLEHPFECALLCVLSVVATLVARRQVS